MTEAAKVKVECWKCDGSGKIRAFSHYAKGVCFGCGGSGWVGTICEGEAHRLMEGGLWMTMHIVLEAAHHGEFKRANFYADGMLDDMFLIGTESARELLDAIVKGAYYDEGELRHCPREQALKVRKYLVEAGRARLASVGN